MTAILYGIKNCDTVKKARRFLENNNINYQFHDFRQEGISTQLITGWCQLTSWENLLNKRSRTYRELADSIKNNINETSIIQLVCEQPTLIKRPVLSYQGQLYIGYSDKEYQEIFSHA
ncbi:Regulatory protein spx (plasmid) [Piscirickettsia salmonis]|uniref:Transcriptional regulator MgsR n=1 Tax=Piscirickettsia salmonis TaxID=1238 RepID=A0A6I5XXG2_PISSA|nr:ArsC family reductase [Piscirickettsia salmonis]ALB23128.1 Transcriptional regulator MgsR [Piscirickettsia salmonis]ALY03059.1 arsenate reductase [Piscirickettsia salmonis]AMA42617.1 arsenate reductase [Piscirickettsia salmonis]AOS35087.1 arsenate reductase [Piscirickettsia salmonis]APS59796.1 arsenate reductase [Piscirickettsia salmonis]